MAVQPNPDLSAQRICRLEICDRGASLLRLITLLTTILACSVCFVAQESDGSSVAVGSAGIYLAKDDGSGKAGDEATSFVTTDVPIYCVVQLESSTPVTVRMNLVAVAVPGVKAETRVVSTSYTTKGKEDRVNFSGRPNGPWVAGRYRVDVFVEDRPAVSREFAVQKPAQARPSSNPSAPKPSDKSRLAGRVKQG